MWWDAGEGSREQPHPQVKKGLVPVIILAVRWWDAVEGSGEGAQP